MKLARLASLAPLVLASACATSKSASLAATTSSSTGPAIPSPPDPPGDELVGKPAPDFTAVAQDGKSVHLAALHGHWTVLYFYPKDETPGCTREACSFRDAWQAIAKTGAILIGISADTNESHRAFVAHYNLPFLLVSDPDGSIGQSYGVPFAGHHQRQTIVIGSDGTVRKVYRKVNVTEHAAQILDDLRQAEPPR
jgi:thioredoxin-dependent peroxiredoxin